MAKAVFSHAPQVAAAAPVPAGTPILVDGRYRVLARLGAGAMGIVYRAEDVSLGRTVAVKVVDPIHNRDVATLERFKKEARALAQVRHENVVQVYAFGPYGASYYFAMEYVAGENLDVIIEEHAARGTTVPLDRALVIARRVALGLGAVHERQLLHRDVKPSNIVMEEQTGRPVIIDFGLARRKSSSNPKLSITAGTPSYMAPEQARDPDGSKLTARADIYALGCTIYELFTGHPVFYGKDIYEIMVAHFSQPPPAISAVRPELAPFDALLIRALAKNPDERHESCAAFVEELDAAACRMVAASHDTKLRAVILASDDRLRKQLTKTVDRVLARAGDQIEVEGTAHTDELVGILARRHMDLVVIDEESIEPSKVGGSDVGDLIARVRGLCPDAQLLVVGRRADGRNQPAPDARVDAALQKPLNIHVLESVVAKLGVRIAVARGGAPSSTR